MKIFILLFHKWIKNSNPDLLISAKGHQQAPPLILCYALRPFKQGQQNLSTAQSVQNLLKNRVNNYQLKVY